MLTQGDIDMIIREVIGTAVLLQRLAAHLELAAYRARVEVQGS